MGRCGPRSRSCVPWVNCRVRGRAKPSPSLCSVMKRRVALAAKPASATTTSVCVPAGGTKAVTISRHRRVWCPRRRGSLSPSATGRRHRSPLATRRTMPQPHGSGADARWRVVSPRGCCRPRGALTGRSPSRDRTPSAGGGRVRRVAIAIGVRPAGASHGADRTIRQVVPSGRVAGREGLRPLRVPCPGARINATTSQQQTRTGGAFAQRKGLLHGYSTGYPLRGMHV